MDTKPKPDKVEKKLLDAEAERKTMGEAKAKLKTKVRELRHIQRGGLLTADQRRRLNSAGRGIFRRGKK